MKRFLSAAEVLELAELLEEAPFRVGAVDEVLQAAAQGRGMTLVLADATSGASAIRARDPSNRGRHEADPKALASQAVQASFNAPPSTGGPPP